MKGKTLLVLGAKSDIGMSVAHKFAKEGYNIQLASRNSEILKEDCFDIKIRYNVDATFHEFDALDIFTVIPLVLRIAAPFEPPDPPDPCTLFSPSMLPV